MVEEVAKNIFRIGVVLPDNPLKELNSYLIRGTQSDVLIDTGFRCGVCREALTRGLEELGSKPERRDVLLTHIHSDHSGMADWFAGAGRTIYLCYTDLEYQRQILYGDINQRRNQRFCSEGFPAEQVEHIFQTNPARKMSLPALTDAFRGLQDGAAITVGEYELQLLHVPGHTPGNAMFWAAKQGILFSGDHVLFDITPNITQWEGMKDSLGAYLDSLKRVKNLPVRQTFPGHRKPGNFQDRVEVLLEHHRQRLAEVLRIVAQTPLLSAYDIAGQMTWKIRANSWETFPLIQKWFAVGECLAHLDHLRQIGLIQRTWFDGIWRYQSS